jgi:type I restriction enzyme S subunit
MNNLTTTTLGEIADSIITGPFGTELHKSDYVESGTPVIMPQNIGMRTFNNEKIAYVDDSNAARLKRYAVIENDIVYSRRGNIEKHAFITENLAGALCGTGCFRVRLKMEEIDPEYISLYLTRPESRLWLVRHAVGSNMQNLNVGILQSVPISFPKKTEQQRIVSILSALEQKIVLNNSINIELDRVSQTIYEYLFFNSKQNELQLLSEKLKFTRGIEPGRNAYFDDCADVDSVPFIRVSDLGQIPAIHISKNDANKSCCFPSDVLVAFDGSIGKMAIGMKGAYSTGIRKIKAKTHEYSDALIYCIFRSEEIQRTIAKYAIGSNILHASSAIEHLTFPWGKEEVEKFNKLVEPMYRLMVDNIQQNIALTKLQNFLLPLLMNRQVRVKT